MKNKILLLLLLVLVFAGCSQENAALPQGGDNAKEVTVRVKMKLNDMVTGLPVTIENGTSTSTRSVTAIDENKINDLWVFQYNVTGAHIKTSYLSSITNFNEFTIPLTATGTGVKCNLYFVANVGPSAVGFSSTVPGLEADFKKLAKTYTTEAQLTQGSDNAVGIPMVGELLNQDVPTATFSTFSVSLKRLLSRVDITYSVAPGFTLSSLCACNVPIAMGYYPTGTVYPTASTANFRSLTPESITASATPVTKTFYLPINMQGKNDNSDPTNKTGDGFPYATYFELTGGTASASVFRSYKFYVGSDAGDYNIEADKYYKINATIKGTSLTDKRVTTGEMSKYSNCYMVAPGSSVTIDAGIVDYARKKYPTANIPALPASYSASVLWQTSPNAGYISVGPCTDGKFTVTVPGGTAPGNAVVCIKNGSSIFWSWHIWVTPYNPVATAKPYNNLNFMDRNLGATEVAPATTAPTLGSYGLYYQWGRKDPLGVAAAVGSATLSTLYTGVTASATYTVPSATSDGNIAKAVLNPSTFYKSSTDWNAIRDDTLWGGSTIKSVFDPCPLGWRVPSFNGTVSCWNGLSTTNFKWDPTAKCCTVDSNSYPASGYRLNSTGELLGVGSYGFYWSGSACGTLGYYLKFYSGSVSPIEYYPRAHGYTLRCVQE